MCVKFQFSIKFRFNVLLGELSPISVHTLQKMKFSIKDFFSKRDQMRSFTWIRSHLLKKYLTESLIFVQGNVYVSRHS